MMSPPRLLCVTALLLVGVGCGGTDLASVSWSVRFACAEDRDNTAQVITRIFQGGCGGDQTKVYEAQHGRGGRRGKKGDDYAPPRLKPGRYGFAATGVDDRGRLVAAGCVEAKLPRDGAVEVTLTSNRQCAVLSTTGAIDVDTEVEVPVTNQWPGVERCRFDPGCDGGIGAFCDGPIDCVTGFCCDDAKHCAGGMCTVACGADEDCPSDMACEHGVCFLRCSDVSECAEGMRCGHKQTVCEWDPPKSLSLPL